ncbi:MAG: DUF5681 domain-containing protein [Bacteroidia bacterium]
MNKNPKFEHLAQYQFKQGITGNPAGRPKKLTTSLIENGYSHSDILKVFHELAWMTKKELDQLAKDENQPAIIQIIAEVLFKGFLNNWSNKGHIQYVAEIFKYLMNKPPQLIATQTHIIHSKAKDITGSAPEPENIPDSNIT